MKIWKAFLPAIASVVLALILVGCEVKKEESGADHPTGDHPTSEQQTDHPEPQHSDHPTSEHPQ